MLDLEILTHFFHHFVVQIGGIVSDNLLGQPVSADYLLMNLTTTLFVTLASKAASTHLVK